MSINVVVLAGNRDLARKHGHPSKWDTEESTADEQVLLRVPDELEERYGYLHPRPFGRGSA